MMTMMMITIIIHSYTKRDEVRREGTGRVKRGERGWEEEGEGGRQMVGRGGEEIKDVNVAEKNS